MRGMMTCQELESFIADYLDGALSWSVRTRFNAHLLMCRECRSYLRTFKLAKDLGKRAFDAPTADVPADVPDDLIVAILDARRH